MLKPAENELITRTGPGTPGGDMMRCYWQPAALSRELKDDEPLPIRLLGEDLVMFRDEAGRPQLVGRACPHRAVDLSFGRVEDGGLRCIYHGWLIDGRGRCLQQPGEREGSTFKDKVRTTAYPCHEAGGLILAYLGNGEPPKLPGFHFLSAPNEQTFTMKVHQRVQLPSGERRQHRSAASLVPASLSARRSRPKPKRRARAQRDHGDGYRTRDRGR